MPPYSVALHWLGHCVYAPSVSRSVELGTKEAGRYAVVVLPEVLVIRMRGTRTLYVARISSLVKLIAWLLFVPNLYQDASNIYCVGVPQALPGWKIEASLCVHVFSCPCQWFCLEEASAPSARAGTTGAKLPESAFGGMKHGPQETLKPRVTCLYKPLERLQNVCCIRGH